jgi:hypothetical protein
LRTSIGSRRTSVPHLQQIERIEKGVRLIAAPAQDVKPGKAALIAAHELAVDQAGPHLEVIHGLNYEREPI